MDMDIEMDIDAGLGIGDDERVLSDPTNIETAELHNISTESPKRILNKVHVRGLNNLNPEEVKAYVAEHYSAELVVKIEWIDDSSANLIFATDAAARDALQGLIADPAKDPEERPAHECILAKSFSAKPDDSFEVRFAIETDKKQAGAAARSRFYLFHPEFDPQERRRRDDSRRYRERDDYGRGRRGRDRRHREEEEDTFDVSLYDDDEVTLASRAERMRRQRRRSSSRSDMDAGDHYRPRRTNEDKELFPDRRPRESGLRSRSASPTRNRDSYETKDDDLMRKSRSRAQEIKEKLSQDNSFKELFPSKHTMTTSTSHMDRAEEANDLMGRKKYGMSYGSTAMDTVSDVSIRGMAAQSDPGIGISIKGRASKSAKELFPDKFGSNNGKELFTDGPGGRNRRRQKAEDLFT